MIYGYRSEQAVEVRVDRSERDAINKANAAADLAKSALKKGIDTCGKGDDCCLSVTDYDSNEVSGTPTHTFKIECTSGDCDTPGIEAAESDIACTVHEMSGS